MVRVPTREELLYKRFGCIMVKLYRLGSRGETKALSLDGFGTPSLFDAVVNESHEPGRDNDVRNIGHGRDEFFIAQPHVTGGDPSPSLVVVSHLGRRAILRYNVSHRCRIGAIAEEMKGYSTSQLVCDPLPRVLVTPPIELVAL